MACCPTPREPPIRSIRAGSNVNQTGSFWHTFDIRGIWRPEWTDLGKHEVSVGAHWDIYSLAQTQTNTNVFTDNYFNSDSGDKSRQDRDQSALSARRLVDRAAVEGDLGRARGILERLRRRQQHARPELCVELRRLSARAGHAADAARRREIGLLAQGGDRISAVPRFHAARLDRTLLSLPDRARAVPEHLRAQFDLDQQSDVAAGERHLL